MKFTLQQAINNNQDLVLPFKKNEDITSKLSSLGVEVKPNFEGKFQEISTLYHSNGSTIYLLGLGEEKHANQLNDAFRKLAFNHKKYWKQGIQINCENLSTKQITQAVTGFEMATYEIGAYKTKQKTESEIEVAIISKEKVEKAIEEGKFAGQSINGVKTLVDAPAHIKTPDNLGNYAINSAKQYGFDCTVLDEKQLQEQGFEAVYAVGKASQYPPRVIIMSYLPKQGETVDLGLVGKGITFDTGGISIKGSSNLHYMKSDMGGAAVVLGAIELAAKLKLNVNIVGVIGCAENAVDAKSYLPGDVINSYSGKTIEIIDTDAEGRLALADGLNYIIKEHNPKEVIDIATLTGSAVRALGYSAGAMFSNNDEMAAKMKAIGDSIHERVWQLPLYADFEEDLHSDIADIRNFSGKPIAGAITAAKFLEAFTEKHSSWMHLDIAGVAFGSNSYAKMKSASGYGIRLIADYIKTL